jgi:ATP-binding cassette subfamily G (WHITE) protein 2 (SNQ2)
VGFFDPEGVDVLEMFLMRQSHSVHELSLDTASAHTVSTIEIIDGKPFDLARTLRKIVQKYAHSLNRMPCCIDCVDRREENDFKPRELGVVFKNLRVMGLGVSASYANTLGSILNPINHIHSFQRLRHPPVRDILTDFEGVIRPGEMLRACIKIVMSSNLPFLF